LGGNLKVKLKKIVFGYKQKPARERNMTITCQIDKSNAKIFKYGGTHLK